MSYTNGLDKPSDYFNTVLWTGDGTSSNSITGVGFQPDWNWIKRRSSVASHHLQDIIRGSTVSVYSNLTNAEGTDVNNVTSFDSDGFTLGNGSGVNTSGVTYVGWNWLADNTTGSSNTDGSITSTVSANTTSGFSIVSWSGTGANATVGHSLGVAPSMIIVKNRGAGEIWVVYNKTIGATKYLSLNSNIASTTSSTIWNDTEPTSSVFNVGTSEQSNRSGYDMIAYCFAEKKGFSKFGSYTGNNNANGPFVYLGFRPAWVLVKDSGSGQHWHLIDSVREPFNDDDASQLSPNSSDSESSVTTNRGTAKIDFLSNGFKINSDGSLLNGTGSFIYMAFASNPFVTSGGIPTTAR